MCPGSSMEGSGGCHRRAPRWGSSSGPRPRRPRPWPSGGPPGPSQRSRRVRRSPRTPRRGPGRPARGVRPPPRGPGRGPDLARRLRDPPGGPARAPPRRLTAGVTPPAAGSTRCSSQRRKPAALECTPFMTSNFSRSSGATVAGLGREALGQGVGDVLAGPEGRARPPRPTGAGSPRPRPADAAGSSEQPVVGEGDARPGAAPRSAAASGSPGRGRSRAAGWPAAACRRRAGGRRPRRRRRGSPDVGVVQAQVVLGVAGRVDRHERAAGAEVDLLAVGQHVQPLGRRGVETAVEGVEERPVDTRAPSRPGAVGSARCRAPSSCT